MGSQIDFRGKVLFPFRLSSEADPTKNEKRAMEDGDCVVVDGLSLLLRGGIDKRACIRSRVHPDTVRTPTGRKDRNMPSSTRILDLPLCVYPFINTPDLPRTNRASIDTASSSPRPD